MSDPIGLISGNGGVGPVRGPGAPSRVGSGTDDGSAKFREMLLGNLQEVNNAQREANAAVEDLMTGGRDDLEGVILATQKADTAFKMLQAVRGKVIAAYDEVRQVRV